MATQTTTIDRIRGVPAAREAARLEWLRIAAAYLLPTFATGAGCYLALAAVARVLGALYAQPLLPH